MHGDWFSADLIIILVIRRIDLDLQNEPGHRAQGLEAIRTVLRVSEPKKQ